MEGYEGRKPGAGVPPLLVPGWCETDWGDPNPASSSLDPLLALASLPTLYPVAIARFCAGPIVQRCSHPSPSHLSELKLSILSFDSG